MQFQDEKEAGRFAILRHHEEEELAQVLSGKYGIDYADLTLVAINADALRLIPEADARAAQMAAFGRVGKHLSVAARLPEYSATKLELQKLADLGYEIKLFLVSEESLKRAWERYADLSYAKSSRAGIFDISNEELESLLAVASDTKKIGELVTEAIKLKAAYRITRILQVILAGGFATGASDIHFEPEEKSVRLRFRLDGVLTDILQFDHETYRLLLSRLKLLSGLKLNVTAEAQDGRFSIKLKGADIEIRSSVLPDAYGETLVMRLLNPTEISVPLEELGMEEKLRTRIEHEITRPNGMILNTGPTGSGKTTTLYAFLRKINSPDTKIITIEDPIEYHLRSIVQTQVEADKKYTFATGLRSALRQDPDIIMVGEIRDEEVAATAINAALTGHLVFSTLHTNDAAGTFPRLIDLGVSEKILSSAINVAMAQRLVRQLCSVCKTERPASPDEAKIIDHYMGKLVDQSLVPQNKTNVWAANPAGCATCGGRSYKGRIGIFEAIFMDSSIEEILRTKPSEREIFAIARTQGIPSMVEDGIIKILRGVTSFEELRRVVDIEER
jgi:type IV pilus assembly protein PilB